MGVPDQVSVISAGLGSPKICSFLPKEKFKTVSKRFFNYLDTVAGATDHQLFLVQARKEARKFRLNL